MAPSGQSTTITHPPLTWKEQLSLWRGTTFCVPHPDRGQKAQQKQRCSSSKPVNTVQVGPNTGMARSVRGTTPSASHQLHLNLAQLRNDLLGANRFPLAISGSFGPGR